MTVAKGNARIMVTLSDEEMQWVDEVADRFRMSRSQVLAKCVNDARDTLGMLDMIGAKPERVVKVVEFLHGLWNMRKPKVEVTGDKVQVK